MTVWGGKAIRWLVAGVVIAVALLIAVWPRGSGEPAHIVPPDLTSARAKAGLAPCAPAAGKVAPEFAAVPVTCMASGTELDFGNLMGGSPVLVNVWASWCVPCQRELPALDAYAATKGALRVIGVQVQSQQSDGLGLLASLGVHHIPMVYDVLNEASATLRLPVGLPVSYLVQPDGTATVITKPARVLDSVDQVRQAVASYLGADARPRERVFGGGSG